SSLFFHLAKKDEVNLGILKSMGCSNKGIASLVLALTMAVGGVYYLVYFLSNLVACYLGDLILAGGIIALFPPFSFPFLMSTGVLLLSMLIASVIGEAKALKARPIQVIKEY
ncbi:MAG: hypothetical protein II721_05980, partial [Bacilli bacterium]|nr:hypothetical protein [Bacilli bacterium]